LANNCAAVAFRGNRAAEQVSSLPIPSKKMPPPPIDLDYKPRFPKNYKPGIGVVGCGGIVKACHLPAYQQHKLNIVGVHDINAAATEDVCEKFGVKRVFSSLDELLACDEIEVVDIGTHPAQRVEIMAKAVAAGKHVLAQKPLALTLDEVLPVLAEAEKRGLKIAVNQNGRWAPAWRIATLLIQQGVIGEVAGVMHLFDKNFLGTPDVFDRVKHFVIYDYSIHWLDITRCWLEKKRPVAVRARDWRTPNQPPETIAPWGAWIEVEYEDGSNAMIRSAGAARRHGGHPFWIHGSEGTIRGSSLSPADWVELELDGATVRYQLDTKWFVDGFAGTMGELLCAIDEKREPYNSARHNLLSLQLVLAACESADGDGRRIELKPIPPAP